MTNGIKRAQHTWQIRDQIGTDKRGNVVFGTDPAALDRAIERGANRDFTRAA